MNRYHRRPRGFLPTSESLEARTVLSLQAPQVQLIHNFLFGSLGSQLARPNTPVAPFAAKSKPTFIDPSASIVTGTRISVGSSDYIAPYAKLNAQAGIIELGSGSTIQENAAIISIANKPAGALGIFIGDNVYIGAGAVIIGSGIIGASKGAATSIGENAVIDNATVQPGAAVGALAQVQPGIIIKTGYEVLPGADVTTQAEADDPSLGKVAKLTGTNSVLTGILEDSVALASGYSTLFQGNTATGSNVATTISTVFNGSLAPVEGASQNPGPPATTTSTTPPSSVTFVAGSPKFFAPVDTLATTRTYTDPFYSFRAIGAVTFPKTDPFTVAQYVGKQTSIRADENEPISIGAIGQLGANNTIHGFANGKITIGDGLVTGNQVAILATSKGNISIGNDVSLGSYDVITGSTLGNDVTVGAASFIEYSTIPAGTIVPAGTIEIDNKIVGTYGD